MKRLQIMIDEDVDRALEAQAARQRGSKGSIVREYVRRGLQPLPPLQDDPLASFAGSVSFEPVDIDETVYGRLSDAPKRR